MLQYRTDKSTFSRFVIISEVVFHSIVRSVRSTHNNAIIAILQNLVQSVLFVAVFYYMMTILPGGRSNTVRGDFLLFMMTGVFMFLMHTKTMGAVLGADGPASPMMQHAPMNSIIAVISAALGELYLQIISMLVILFIYHTAFKPITIEEPAQAFGMFLLAWASGAAIGLLLYVIKPWLPGAVKIVSMVYLRSNMIFSGKMVLAGVLPGYILPFFTWNPLFHTIDQARGHVFINYNATVTNWHYTAWLAIIFFVLGLMGEFYTRRMASLSWDARR